MLGISSFAREKVVAVVDIGSGSAGAAIIAARKDGAATILAAERSILPLEERTKEQTMRGVISMITESCTKVLDTYAKSASGKHLGPPGIVYAIVRAPWTRASAGKAARIFPKDEIVTKEMITEIAREAFEADHELDRANILETSVIRVELNEYPTGKPIGRKAHRINVVTFESDFDPVMHKSIVNALNGVFPGLPQTLRSGARTFLSIVQERMEHPSAYVIIDMVSEATTYMAIRDGVITHHAVMPEGVRTILRKVAGVEGMPDEILNLMRMVVAGSCSGEACDTLNAALAKAEPDLVRTFGEAFGGFVGKRRLPDTMILAAHPDITTWLAHVFSRIDFAQFTMTMRPFSVRIMSPADLQDAAVPASGVAIDTGIVVASGFVNTELQRD